MAPLEGAERGAIISASPLLPQYAERVDRESALEMLTARMGQDREREREVRRQAPREPRPEPSRPREKDVVGQMGDFLTSRQGQRLQKQVMRGLFGLLKR